MTRWSVLVLAVCGAWGLAVLASACGSHKGSPAAAPEDFPDGAGGPEDGGTVGQIDGGLANTGLPTLPELVNVVGTEREDSVGIDFDPVDDAVDYRVYPLPSPGDITVNGDGSLTIKNAVYRCAGLRQTYDLPNNTTNNLTAPDAGQLYENPNEQYSWTAQIPATPTLGYVYVTPGQGLVPVYAIGEHPTAPEDRLARDPAEDLHDGRDAAGLARRERRARRRHRLLRPVGRRSRDDDDLPLGDGRSAGRTSRSTRSTTSGRPTSRPARAIRRPRRPRSRSSPPPPPAPSRSWRSSTSRGRTTPSSPSARSDSSAQRTRVPGRSGTSSGRDDAARRRSSSRRSRRDAHSRDSSLRSLWPRLRTSRC